MLFQCTYLISGSLQDSLVCHPRSNVTQSVSTTLIFGTAVPRLFLQQQQQVKVLHCEISQDLLDKLPKNSVTDIVGCQTTSPPN